MKLGEAGRRSGSSADQNGEVAGSQLLLVVEEDKISFDTLSNDNTSVYIVKVMQTWEGLHILLHHDYIIIRPQLELDCCLFEDVWVLSLSPSDIFYPAMDQTSGKQ